MLASSKYHLASLPIRLLDSVGMAPRPRTSVVFVSERANWSTKWDGYYICREVERLAPATIEQSYRPELLAQRIVHFGSQFQWVAWSGALAHSNRTVATYFHGKPEDDAEMARHVEGFLATVPRLARVVTAASLVESRLLSWGVPREKLVRIPIGVDLGLFNPVTAERRVRARARYGIAEDQLVIGSFQKDGVGWGEGAVPKNIKGPDVLLDTVSRVAGKRKVLVLLTGPARGYVIAGLERLGVPYVHELVEDYETLPEVYAALDVYLNPSLEEGGPKGIIEAMASHVPVVSTKVGMAPDLIRSGENGWLCDVGDAEGLAQAILDVAEDRSGRTRMLEAARQSVAVCDWANVGRRHYEEVYRPLLEDSGRRRANG